MKIDFRQYQKEDIKRATDLFLKEKMRAVVLAHETGLGKSLMSLTITDNVMKKAEFKKIIIMSPAFLKENWLDEINKWLPKKRAYNIILKSYSEIIKPEELRHLTKYKYDLLILDEFHYLKDFASLRTLAVFGAPATQHLPLIKKCKQVLPLSATPIPQRVGEIYPFLWATRNPILNGQTYEQFLSKWAGESWASPFGIRHKGVKNADLLKQALFKTLIRRKKREVLHELPPENRSFITLPCSVKMYEQEKKLLQELLVLAGYANIHVEQLLKNPGLLQQIIESVPGFEKMTAFKIQQGLIKIKYVMEHLKNSVLNETQKFILVCFHKDVAFKYAELLEKEKKTAIKAGLNYSYDITVITGETPASERLAIIKKINALPNQILICTMGAIKEGFNITGFSYTYFAEIDWKNYVLEQVEGRTLRIGQKNPVFWYYFIFGKGIERTIYNNVNEKNETVKKVIG